MVKTTPEEIPKQRHGVIQPGWKDGLHCMCADRPIMTGLPKCRGVYLRTVKKSCLITTQPCQKYGIPFPKRINKTVKGLQLSGTKCKSQKMFSESEWHPELIAQRSLTLMCRLSKKILSHVAEWTEFMRNKTGVVLFVMAAYTDEDGGLSIGRWIFIFIFNYTYGSWLRLRYETSGLNFMSTQTEVRKGPNNITDVWTKFIEGRAFLILLQATAY